MRLIASFVAGIFLIPLALVAIPLAFVVRVIFGPDPPAQETPRGDA